MHDLLRVLDQLDSDREDLEFIVRRALARGVAQGLDDDLRVVASISRGQINIQLLNHLSFDVLQEAEFTVSYLYDAGREAASLGLHQARVDLISRIVEAFTALDLCKLALVERSA